jgi:hypothetical protein
MFSSRPFGRPSHRQVQASVALLAIVLFAGTTLLAASHNEAPNHICPICQIANLPLIRPANVVQLAPLKVIERRAAVAESVQEKKAARTSSSPRAPPA